LSLTGLRGSIATVSIVTSTPTPDKLGEAVLALREWQHDGAPAQLHPGDLGWHWSYGAQATADAVRTWSRDGQVLAVGLLDGPAVLRLAVAPEAVRDEQLAQQLVADIDQPERGVLPDGDVAVEARLDGPIRELLLEKGWEPGEAWTPFQRDLARGVNKRGVRIEIAGREQVGVRVAVQRAAFDRSTFTDERWHAMAAGPAYADARCLVAYDDQGTAVAAATVWSAGAGRPGLVEPMGVHRDHRGRGYGTAISVAAAAALARPGGIERDRLHPQLQRRRRCHLRVGRLPAAP